MGVSDVQLLDTYKYSLKSCADLSIAGVPMRVAFRVAIKMVIYTQNNNSPHGIGVAPSLPNPIVNWSSRIRGPTIGR